MPERSCARCGNENPRPTARLCFRCKKSLENAKRRGTTAPPPLTAFDCEWCGKTCVRGVDVVPHASRFCSVEHKKAWHHQHVEGQRVGAIQEGRLARWTERLLAEPTARQVTRYRRALRSDPCSYCGGTAGALDHIEPKNEGGIDGVDNRTASCRRCNSTKGTLPLLQALLFVPAANEYHDLRRLLYAA